MLRELHITNLAVIEDARLDLSEGLNCFTGQTGAGKSLVLGAFEILLGLRAGSVSDMIRPGADEARVSGVFELRDAWARGQIALLADLPPDDAHELLITRKLFSSGRSSVSVNGQPATAAMVRAIGELLVDVHGQHDHQYLLKPSNQLVILDAFGKSLELRERFGQVYAGLRDLRARQRELAASRTLRRQQLELYEFQAQELDEARLVPGEYDELRQRHALLSNVQRIQRDAGQAHAALYEAEGSVVERLQMIVHLLSDLAELDAALGETAQQARTATLSLQDAAFELGRYVDRLEMDPAELAEVEDRLNTLNRLIAKYSGGASTGADPVADLMSYREQVEARLRELRGQNEDLSTMDAQTAELERELSALGGRLTKMRRAAGDKLAPLVERELKDLGMAEAQLAVEFAPADGEDGGASGLDSVEFLVRTNPGQPARPLRKIASGGELSRIMLAIKSILAHSDRVSVLVFDEIDANVGGRMGTVIGQKLRGLANPRGRGDGGSHQVLCITHLPQIAAFADRHLRIAKAVQGRGKDKQTRTTVTALSGHDRVEELAEMLAGHEVSETTRKQVKEMLAAAG